MKKIMIGLLFLIPIIILLLVAAVSNIVSTQAYIGVESITISALNGDSNLVFNLSELSNDPIDLNNYLSIQITPDKVTNKTVEWSIMDVLYLDEEYEESYKHYLENKDTVEKVNPAVMLVDENKNEVESNTSGLILINTYCSFSIRVNAESYSDTISCYVVGYDVEKINLVDSDGNYSKTINSGDSFKLYANLTPIDSIVDNKEWYSSDDSIAKVDQNGVVTALNNGEAYIYLKAAKYSNQNVFVESIGYKVQVNKGASLYGNKFYSHSSVLSLSNLGIEGVISIDGGEINGDELTITSSSVKINTANGLVEIIKCEEDSIVIENAKYLNSDSDEVLEVGDSSLKLKVRYLSSLKNDLVNAIWTTSNSDIAEVDNGVVKAKKSGIVLVTATFNGNVATIELNIQKKVTSMSLYTSNNYYEKVVGGLARETVFASERFVNYPTTNDITANYTYILVKGSENLEGDALKEFINAYKYEIVSGSEYAYFDSDEINKLVFKNTLEGKGKQEIKVLVSAKYPKYVTKTNYTKEEVTIKAIYGIEANSVYELKKASIIQKDYAYREDNIVVTTDDIRTCYKLGEEAKVSSKNYYAISLMSDIYYPKTLEDQFFRFFSCDDMYSASIALYGNLYGNNHILAGYRELFLTPHAPIIRVTWSDVTISNITIRANQLEGNTEIVSGDETKELRGKAITAGSEENDQKFRLRNIKLEYSILENTYQTMDFRNIDFTFDGCIIRNLCNVGCYVPTRLRNVDGYIHPCYSRVVANNFVVSNALGSAFSISQEGCLKVDGVNIYSEDDDENTRFVEEMRANGFTSELRQTGFFDAYNWQSTESAKLLQSGDDTIDSLVGGLTQSILNISKLDGYRYRYKGVDYFNIGFIVSGISTSGGIQVEPIFANIYMEDTRFTSFSLMDLKDEDDPLLTTVAEFTLTIYGYDNQSDLKPSSVLKINDKFIEKLHN